MRECGRFWALSKGRAETILCEAFLTRNRSLLGGSGKQVLDTQTDGTCPVEASRDRFCRRRRLVVYGVSVGIRPLPIDYSH